MRYVCALGDHTNTFKLCMTQEINSKTKYLHIYKRMLKYCHLTLITFSISGAETSIKTFNKINTKKAKIDYTIDYICYKSISRLEGVVSSIF